MEINSVLEFIEQIEKLEGERKHSENLYFRGENDIFPQRVPSMYRGDKGKAIYPRLINEGPRDYYYELFEELGWTSTTFSQKTFEKIIEKDLFPIEKYISMIKDKMYEKKELYFEDLVFYNGTKSELITIFISILELVKNNIIKIFQDKDKNIKLNLVGGEVE